MTDPEFASGGRHLPAPLLVGRGREQALLREHLTSALASRDSLVLIGGEAGIGKSALTEVLAVDAVAQGTAHYVRIRIEWQDAVGQPLAGFPARTPPPPAAPTS